MGREGAGGVSDRPVLDLVSDRVVPTQTPETAMNVLSLFSGIGGLELGLERAGMTVVGQVEIDPFCRRVLAKHWPEVPRHNDVRTAVEWWRGEPRPRVDLVCGGFPCQPVSVAGRHLAQADERWLWPTFAGVVRQLRPHWVLLENVPGLLGRGAGDVLGDLAALGYDAEWGCIPAVAVGAPHLRDRWFCVAYPNGNQHEGRAPALGQSATKKLLADTDGAGPSRRAGQEGRRPGTARRMEPERLGGRIAWERPAVRGDWATEPDVGRVAHGVPGRVDRLRGLGNAVVPQVSEYVGRLILSSARAATQ